MAQGVLSAADNGTDDRWPEETDINNPIVEEQNVPDADVLEEEELAETENVTGSTSTEELEQGDILDDAEITEEATGQVDEEKLDSNHEESKKDTQGSESQDDAEEVTLSPDPDSSSHGTSEEETPETEKTQDTAEEVTLTPDSDSSSQGASEEETPETEKAQDNADEVTLTSDSDSSSHRTSEEETPETVETEDLGDQVEAREALCRLMRRYRDALSLNDDLQCGDSVVFGDQGGQQFKLGFSKDYEFLFQG